MTSLISIAEGAKTDVGLQCNDSSCVGDFLLGEEGGVDFFAFATHDEELLNSSDESARISVFSCKATMIRVFKRSKEDILKTTAYLLYVEASAA